MPTKKKDKLGPYVENYPPLQKWLTKHRARCVAPPSFIECWMIGTKLFIIQVHHSLNGWNIFTPLDDHRVSETFADAERRLGVCGTCLGSAHEGSCQSPLVTIYLDQAGIDMADEWMGHADVDKILGAEVSVGLAAPGRGYINIETRDEHVIRCAEDHFAGHVLEISRNWEPADATKPR